MHASRILRIITFLRIMQSTLHLTCLHRLSWSDAFYIFRIGATDTVFKKCYTLLSLEDVVIENFKNDWYEAAKAECRRLPNGNLLNIVALQKYRTQMDDVTYNVAIQKIPGNFTVLSGIRVLDTTDNTADSFKVVELTGVGTFNGTSLFADNQVLQGVEWLNIKYLSVGSDLKLPMCLYSMKTTLLPNEKNMIKQMLPCKVGKFYVMKKENKPATYCTYDYMKECEQWIDAKNVCRCVPGYTGQFCNEDINECASNPCSKNSKCLNLLNKYQCTCNPGYTGPTCHTKILSCEPNPCINDGKCRDMEGYHVCDCVLGFSGQNCETDIRPCWSAPCKNGQCLSTNDSFICSCNSNFTGVLCETLIEPSKEGKEGLSGAILFASAIVPGVFLSILGGFLIVKKQTAINERYRRVCLYPYKKNLRRQSQSTEMQSRTGVEAPKTFTAKTKMLRSNVRNSVGDSANPQTG